MNTSLSSCQCHCHLSQSNTIDKLNSTIETLNKKMQKLNLQITELKKLNKNLNSKINLLINEDDIVKNVKMDIQDYSDYSQFHNEDTLKEFFYLLVLSEKMKYLNLDHIWMIDSALLYKEVLHSDLPFYEWGNFLSRKLEAENEEYMNKMRTNMCNSGGDSGIISKLRNLWYDSSLTFFNKIKVINGKALDNNTNQSNHPSQQSNTHISNSYSSNSNQRSDQSPKAITHSTNISTGCSNHNNSNNSSDLKKKYLEILKTNNKNKFTNKTKQNTIGENEIERLLIENENSFNDGNFDTSYNSFLN